MESKNSKNIYQRFIEVQKKVRSVQKKESVEMGNNSYKAVTHDDVAALLHLPLAEQGIVMLPDVAEYSITDFQVEKYDKWKKTNYQQKWYRADLKIKVKWINADKPEDFFESTGGAFALDTSDKAFAKAYSLALKIVLLKVHLLESRDGEEQRLFEERSPDPPPKPKSYAPTGTSKPPAMDEFDNYMNDEPPLDPKSMTPNQRLNQLVVAKKLNVNHVKNIIGIYAGAENTKAFNDLDSDIQEQVINHIAQK